MANSRFFSVNLKGNSNLNNWQKLINANYHYLSLQLSTCMAPNEIWPTLRENLSPEVYDQVRLKSACSATEASKPKNFAYNNYRYPNIYAANIKDAD